MKNVDELIRQAMAEGKFSNLKGKGRRLKLEENPLEDSDWRMAHHILKNSGFTLPWIEKRRELEAAVAKARAGLHSAWHIREHDPSQDGQWRRACNAFRQEVEKLNKGIRAYNLEAPSSYFHLRPMRAEMEIERAKDSLD